MSTVALRFPGDELTHIVRLGLLTGPFVPVHEPVRLIQLIRELVVFRQFADVALDSRPVGFEAAQLNPALLTKAAGAVEPQLVAKDATP